MNVEVYILALSVKENSVVYCRIIPRIVVCIGTLPDHFTHKIVNPEYFVQCNFDIVTYVPVNMDVKTAIISEKFTEENDRLIEPFQIRVQPFAPGVPICLLFDDGRLFDEGEWFPLLVIGIYICKLGGA